MQDVSALDTWQGTDEGKGATLESSGAVMGLILVGSSLGVLAYAW